MWVGIYSVKWIYNFSDNIGLGVNLWLDNFWEVIFLEG